MFDKLLALVIALMMIFAATAIHPVLGVFTLLLVLLSIF